MIACKCMILYMGTSTCIFLPQLPDVRCPVLGPFAKLHDSSKAFPSGQKAATLLCNLAGFLLKGAGFRWGMAVFMQLSLSPLSATELRIKFDHSPQLVLRVELVGLFQAPLPGLAILVADLLPEELLGCTHPRMRVKLKSRVSTCMHVYNACACMRS